MKLLLYVITLFVASGYVPTHEIEAYTRVWTKLQYKFLKVVRNGDRFFIHRTEICDFVVKWDKKVYRRQEGECWGICGPFRDKGLRMYDVTNVERSGTALCVLPQNVSTGICYDVRRNDVLPQKIYRRKKYLQSKFIFNTKRIIYMRNYERKRIDLQRRSWLFRCC